MSDEKIKKCSLEVHKDIDSIYFCKECKIYMCKECEIYHYKIFKNNHKLKSEKNIDITEIFTGLCKEKNHLDILKYFCKNHNELCCAKCITKIKTKEIGQHKDCDICIIEDIEKEKKDKLKENIKILEDFSSNLQQSINELKKIFEKIEKDKEAIKLNIQTIFTKLRNILNVREDKLLSDVDQKYNELFFNEDNIKDCEKLPKKVKTSLEKGKLIANEWNNNLLNFLIYNCLNIEKSIKSMNEISENIKKYNSLNSEISFFPEEDGINELVETIKKFGSIYDKNQFNSKIEFDESLIKLWLNGRDFKPELLFRKTRDGSSIKDFHNKCDNKGTTIVFIETTKGYKFGGYTELQWDNSGKYKKDKSTFIFSFNKKQKYIAIKDSNSIYCSSSEGPRFGSNSYPEIYIPNSLDKGQSYNETFLSNKELTNGETNWDIKEFEVYKINYI